MHRFFCKEIPAAGCCAQLDERDRKHLFKTLRARPGEEIELADGCGSIALARVSDDNSVLVESREQAAQPDFRVHLFVAPPRRQKMDQLLRQCAESGVWRIVPILTERGVSQPEDSVLERWDSVLLEACKQAKNPFHPEVRPLTPFSDALASSKDMSLCFGSPQGSWPPEPIPPAKQELAWFVGPEGGFSPAEENALLAAGASPFRIGPWVMRVETAAICGAALLLFLQARKGALQ